MLQPNIINFIGNNNPYTPSIENPPLNPITLVASTALQGLDPSTSPQSKSIIKVTEENITAITLSFIERYDNKTDPAEEDWDFRVGTVYGFLYQLRLLVTPNLIATLLNRCLEDEKLAKDVIDQIFCFILDQRIPIYDDPGCRLALQKMKTLPNLNGYTFSIALLRDGEVTLKKEFKYSSALIPLKSSRAMFRTVFSRTTAEFESNCTRFSQFFDYIYGFYSEWPSDAERLAEICDYLGVQDDIQPVEECLKIVSNQISSLEGKSLGEEDLPVLRRALLISLRFNDSTLLALIFNLYYGNNLSQVITQVSELQSDRTLCKSHTSRRFNFFESLIHNLHIAIEDDSADKQFLFAVLDEICKQGQQLKLTDRCYQIFDRYFNDPDVSNLTILVGQQEFFLRRELLQTPFFISMQHFREGREGHIDLTDSFHDPELAQQVLKLACLPFERMNEEQKEWQQLSLLAFKPVKLLNFYLQLEMFAFSDQFLARVWEFTLKQASIENIQGLYDFAALRRDHLSQNYLGNLALSLVQRDSLHQKDLQTSPELQSIVTIAKTQLQDKKEIDLTGNGSMDRSFIRFLKECCPRLEKIHISVSSQLHQELFQALPALEAAYVGGLLYYRTCDYNPDY
jgi:hypothetical protein